MSRLAGQSTKLSSGKTQVRSSEALIDLQDDANLVALLLAESQRFTWELECLGCIFGGQNLIHHAQVHRVIINDDDERFSLFGLFRA